MHYSRAACFEFVGAAAGRVVMVAASRCFSANSSQRSKAGVGAGAVAFQISGRACDVACSLPPLFVRLHRLPPSLVAPRHLLLRCWLQGMQNIFFYLFSVVIQAAPPDTRPHPQTVAQLSASHSRWRKQPIQSCLRAASARSFPAPLSKKPLRPHLLLHHLFCTTSLAKRVQTSCRTASIITPSYCLPDLTSEAIWGGGGPVI